MSLIRECSGRLAQWLERLVHTEEVGGSNPPSPTIGLTPTLPAASLVVNLAEVAKWQTRCVQGAVSLRTCGFKSLPRHQIVPATGHPAGLLVRLKVPRGARSRGIHR